MAKWFAVVPRGHATFRKATVPERRGGVKAAWQRPIEGPEAAAIRRRCSCARAY
jgi:hypothetical protein